MKTRSHTPARALIVGTTAAALALLAGCSAAGSYRNNPTPELSTLSHTNDEVNNKLAVTFDTNLGAMWEDAARFMLLDRPSLLMRPRTPY